MVMADSKRRFVELIVAAGRKWQKKQTGLIHYFYENQEGEEHDTIPILENFYFALALVKTNLSDNILRSEKSHRTAPPLRGGGQLSHLLARLPSVQRPLSLTASFGRLHALTRDGSHLIGEELTFKLKSLDQRVRRHGEKIHAERALPANRLVFLRWLNTTPTSATGWGDFLIAHQMYDPSNTAFVEEAAKQWHRASRTPTLATTLSPAN